MSEPRSRQHLRASAGACVLECAASSDVGTVRRENQDAWAVEPLDDGGVALVVADGMGGHADGAIAADLATASAVARLRAAGEDADRLAEAVGRATAAIARRRAAHGGRVIGTTLVAALVRAAGATIANVGDSRAYVVSAGSGARPVTEDHSWVAEQVRAGALSAAAAATDPRRGIVTRALTGEAVEPDITAVALRPGDVVVLVSDGVWGVLGDAVIGALLGPGDLEAAVAGLVTEAIHAGSTDNCTAVACRVGA